jgi:hypothetical protein
MKALKFAGALAALAFTGALATSAAADTYYLTVSSAFPSGPTYGTVTTTQNGSDVDVSVTLASGYQFVTTGGPHTLFTFNIDDASYGVTNVDPSVLSWDQPGTNPDFGTFTDAIVCTGCSNGGAGAVDGPLTFTVTNTTLDAFTPNSDGFTFSADIVGNRITGAVGDGGLTPGVPEPATWAMMILGLGMVGAGLRMRRRSALTPA